jgi:predicted porin
MKKSNKTAIWETGRTDKAKRSIAQKLSFCAIPVLAGAAGFLGAAPAAHADYTLYAGNGPVPSIDVEIRIDAGFRLLTNVDNFQYNGGRGTGVVLEGGGNDWGTSLYGLSGTSIISPELSGVYRLEGGFDATNGQFNGGNNSLFNRRAYAGLSNPQFGTILIGKDLFIDNDVYSADPMTQQNASTSTLVLGRNWGGTSQMAEYRSPTWGGFKIGFMGAAPDTPKANGLSSYGVSAQYTLANLNVYAIADDVHDAKGKFSSLYSASREAIFAATYAIEPVTLFGGYEILSAPDDKASDPLSTSYSPYKSIYATAADMIWVGAEYQATPALLLQGGFFRTWVNHSGGTANLFAGGATYNLNKYVFLYTTVAEILNSGNAAFTADIYSPAPRPGQAQTAVYSGFGFSW